MNPSVIFICLILAFVAFTETDAVRGGWASGANVDRDPSNPNNKPEGQQNANPSQINEEGQRADAKASGDHPIVHTSTIKKGPNRVTYSAASGTEYASSYASAK